MGFPVSAGSGTTASRHDGLPIWSSWVATSKPESGCGQFRRGPTRTSTDRKNSSRSTHSEAIYRRDGVCRDPFRCTGWPGWGTWAIPTTIRQQKLLGSTDVAFSGISVSEHRGENFSLTCKCP